MANPPITIGPFANVPAPGSPIRSDWAQQISTYVWQHAPRFGVAVGPDVNYTALGLVTYANVAIPTVTWATRTQFVVDVKFGFAAGDGAIIDADVTNAAGAVVPGSGMSQRNAARPGQFSSATLVGGFDVAASGNAGFNIRVNVLALGGGNVHVLANAAWINGPQP
jgi:hypothetical protein